MNHLEQLQAGLKQYQSGDLDKAEQLFRQVLASDSDNYHALNLLGMVCVNSRRPGEAIELISKALDMKPQDPQAHANIALACKDLGDYERAEKHLQQSVALNAGNPRTWNNLGNVQRELGKLTAAVKSFEQALSFDDTYAECLGNLSLVLAELGEFDRASQTAGRALSFNPEMPQALCGVAEVLNRQYKFGPAIESFEKALEIDPGYVEAMLGLALAYRETERPEKALEVLNRAVEANPGYGKTFSSLGTLYEQLGDKDAAIASFKRAIELSPQVAFPHYQLAKFKGHCTSDEELAALEKLRGSGLCAGEMDKSYLHYALATVYDQRDRVDEAFTAWQIANGLRADRFPYDPDLRARMADRVIAHCGELKGLDLEVSESTPRMLFILGMPRSGTSLTDQVLSSHSQVESLGEVGYSEAMSHEVKRLTGSAFPSGLAELSNDMLLSLQDGYMANVPQHLRETRWLIDKTPMNVQYLGLLAEVFPNARFIHCHRNPVDNCFSIYKLPFNEQQDYAHTLPALGHYYCISSELMQRWKTLYPDRILDVCYEETVADIEAQCRRMIDFIGLDFEPGMLEFYAARRQVRTPSASQVRQPIYASSVAAWKRYEKQLAPLLEHFPADWIEQGIS